MTALEELTEKVYERTRNFESKEPYKDWIQELNKKYSVTLRNTSESADNAKSEQVINQEQMMSQIEDIALDMANSVPNQNSKYNRKDSYEFEHFQQELKDCFAMHFKEKV